METLRAIGLGFQLLDFFANEIPDPMFGQVNLRPIHAQGMDDFAYLPFLDHVKIVDLVLFWAHFTAHPSYGLVDEVFLPLFNPYPFMITTLLPDLVIQETAIDVPMYGVFFAPLPAFLFSEVVDDAAFGNLIEPSLEGGSLGLIFEFGYALGDSDHRLLDDILSVLLIQSVA